MKNIFLVLLTLAAANGFAQPTQWSARLHREDGKDIVFSFSWKTEHSKPVWFIHNAGESIRIDSIIIKADSLFIQMPVFESQFKLKYSAGQLTGNWIKGGAAATQVMAFTAIPGNKRFGRTGEANKRITGRWAAHFSSNAHNDISVAELVQSGNRVTGTFLNPTGDYRYLEGIVINDTLMLSGFDGGHAFLFTALLDRNDSLSNGHFYSGPKYTEAWSAHKDEHAKVSESSVAMSLRPGEEKLHFTFNDLDKRPVSINDDRFKNKVVVIQLMGSWCPNCMDETAFLSDYYNHNRQRGIEIIALAYEYSTDWDRSLKSLRKFQKRFDIQYTILNTGVTVTDSLRTEKTLPELTDIKFFPSSVIIDKHGMVRKLDTGFNGPATGIHYTEYKKEFEDTIEKLLREE